MSATTRRPGKFVWLEHESADARGAQAFYGEVLGWKVYTWGGPTEPAYDMILAGDGPHSMIGGYGAPSHAGAPARFLAYVSVPDVDAAAKATRDAGGKVLAPPSDLPGAGRIARIADPQGAELCLFCKEGGDPEDPPATAPPPARTFFWNELHTPDPDAALAFYEKVVGYARETMDMGPAGAYHILSRDGVGRAGVTSHMGGDVAGGAAHWLPYIAVDDPDATLARARAHGGQVLVGPHDIPGIGRFGVIEDPTGAVLAVMKALPPTPKG
jgi:predicted enzyme related to lactoylglutathione lyase